MAYDTPAPNAWTTERTELLIEMWNQGETSLRIARVLGGVSRNAVIGKIHRLRQAHPGTLVDRLIPTRRLRKKPKTKTKPKLARKPAKAPPWQREILEEEMHIKTPVSPGYDITDLARHQCRYAINDAQPHLFCGSKTQPGQSYCAFHTVKVFRQKEQNSSLTAREA